WQVNARRQGMFREARACQNGRAGPSDARNSSSPNRKMTVAPPMLQVVHTTLVQAALLPPSLSASSREPNARVASTATVMAVPNAMAKVAATPAQKSPCVTAKTSTRIAPVQGLMPTENTTDITFRHEHGVVACLPLC